MTNWIEQIRIRKRLRYLIIILLLGLALILPQQYVITDIAYVFILFLIIYFSSYIQTAPLWKGFFYSLIVMIIVVFVFLSIIILFPHIPFMLLLAIVFLTAGLCVYWIG